MISYRKPNRARDLVGAIIFAVAAAMLWVQSSMAGPADSAGVDGTRATSTAEIRSATSGGSGAV